MTLAPMLRIGTIEESVQTGPDKTLLFTPPSESIKSDEIQKNILWITFGLLEAVVDRFQETFLQTGVVHITCLP